MTTPTSDYDRETLERWLGPTCSVAQIDFEDTVDWDNDDDGKPMECRYYRVWTWEPAEEDVDGLQV